jgi:hypothetical protein
MKQVSEERIRLRVEYSRETDLIFSDNIPAYADWLERKLALRQPHVNKRLLFAAYLQGKRDQIYWSSKWEDYKPIGRYRVMKQFLKWYSTVC